MKETSDDYEYTKQQQHYHQHNPQQEQQSNPKLFGYDYDPSVFLYAIAHLPTVFVMSIFTLLCTWSLTSLTLFHGVIISVAQTTNERVRNVYKDDRNDHGEINPADKGFVKNWMNAFCSEIPESRIPEDFSQEVDCLEGRRLRDKYLMSLNENEDDSEDDYEEEDDDDYDDDDDDDDDDDEEEGGDSLEGMYDSQRAAKAVASSVENGIVYSF